MVEKRYRDIIMNTEPNLTIGDAIELSSPESNSDELNEVFPMNPLRAAWFGVMWDRHPSVEALYGR